MSDLPRLYSYFRSSSSWRVRIVLALKGIEYSYEAVNLVKGEQHGAAFAAVNPFHAVPTLVIDGHTIPESVAICEYLEETRPDPPLLPEDPYLRARTRQVVELCNAGVQPLQNLRVLKKIEEDFGQDAAGKVAWAGHFNALGLEAIESVLEDTAGLYSIEDSPTLADAFLIPQVASARRFGVEVERFPIIARLDEALGELEPFVAADAAHQPDTPDDFAG